MSREEMAETLGASTEDLQAVRAFAKQYGLPVTDENAEARTLHLDGTAQQMAAAFQTDLGMVEDTSGRHLSYKGPLTVPASLKDVVTAVLGLDKRPIAKRHDDHMQSPVNREDSPPQAASSNAGESTSTDQGTS
jgi:kumamolisin